MSYDVSVGEQDFAKAGNLFHHAAERGHVDSQLSLGQIYELGLAGKVNKELAYKWTKAAADQNHPTAEFRMGMFYRSGGVCEKDPVEARRWFERAAKQGHSFYQSRHCDEVWA